MTNDLLRLPAEWEPQEGVLLTWPHEGTDWAPYLDEIESTFVSIAHEITLREKLWIATPYPDAVRRRLSETCSTLQMERVVFCCCATNDTWARDHGFISLVNDHGSRHLLDFCFNGWGEKFESSDDNSINRHLFLQEQIIGEYEDHLDFVLEGGSIESDGRGTILTTSTCLLAPHRNQPLTREEIEEQLLRRLHGRRIIWLNHGHLQGDDTDGHIDTIVRMTPDGTLLYATTDDMLDGDYPTLGLLERELRDLRTADGAPYRVEALPQPAPIHYDGERLPATYANFLVINGAVLVPTYAQPERDREALRIIGSHHPGRAIVGIDSRVIIRQHGSIHCLTMQIPALGGQSM